MNDLDIKLSAALDALTELEESMAGFHTIAMACVPIKRWEELTRSVRTNVESAASISQPGRVTRIADSVKRKLAG